MLHRIGRQALCVLALALLWMPIQSKADEWTRNNVRYSFTIVGNEASINRVEILGSDITGGVNIPSQVLVERQDGFDTVMTWYPVRSFMGNIGGQYSCTGVAIGNGIVEIGANAFKGYAKFTHVVFPASIKRVGMDAFTGCGEFGVIDIEPEALAAWCDIDFANAGANPLICTKNGLAWIDRSIYVNGYPVVRTYKDMTIPYGISEIKQYAFCGHKSLETIEIPWSCEKIGTGSFSGCYKLKSLTLPDSVASIGDNAFQGCRSLSTLTIGNSITNIGHGAFQECTNLQSVDIGDGLASVSSNLFKGCTSLLSVGIGANVETIGAHAFESCTSLTNVVFPSGLTSIGEHAFHKCAQVGNGITGGFRGMELPSTVTNIGSYAFSECHGMYYFIIPTSVKTLGTDITKKCDSLINIIGPRRFKTYFQSCNPTAFYTYNDVKVTFDANGGEVGTESMLVDIYSRIDDLPIPLKWNHKFLGWFTAVDGGEQVTSSTSMSNDMTLYARWEAVEYEWSYEENGDGGIRITGASPMEGNMEIPPEIDGKVVTAIGYTAFYSADALTGIKLPGGVKEIGPSAFGECPRLSRIEFAEGLEYIGHSAFNHCWSIKEIKIPSSVKEVDAQAFYGSSATNIVLLEGIQRIGATAIPAYNVSSLEIPASVSILGDGWEYYSCPIYGCNNLSVAAGNAAFKMEDGMLLSRDGTRLISVNAGKPEFSIPASVKSIDYGAFECYDWWNNEGGIFDFETIPGICLADGWMIGYRSDDVPLDLDLTHIRGIQSLALMGCPAKTIKLPSQLARIDGSCFIWCSNLQNVEIPVSCVEIGCSAFLGCENLSSIIIPQNVTNISSGAFSGCDHLQTVVVPKFIDGVASQFDNTTSVYYYDGDPPTTLSFVTIALDATGGDTSTNNVRGVVSCEVGILPIPLRVGYMFLGWFTAAEGGEPVTAETVVTGDMTLYAHWGELPFSATGGDAEWGGDSGGSWRSGAITDEQTSWAEVAVTGPCLVSFKWKSSSESGCDWLTFYVDGEQKDRISGEMNAWADYSLAIADSGPHMLRWTYSKDGSALDGEDCGWVKDFAATPAVIVTVTFDANGGIIEDKGTADILVAQGTSIGTLPEPVPASPNLEFAGWWTSTDESGEIVTEDIPVEGSMTIYAHWQEREIAPEWYYYEVEDSEGNSVGAVIDGYSVNFAGPLEIPSLIGGLPVIGIADGAFEGALITAVTIPDSVASIGEGAFQDCCGLTSIAIPDSVTNVGECAFSGCENLTGASVPQVLCLGPESGMSFMGAGLDYVTNLVINGGVTSIGDYAFEYCENIVSVTLPGSLTDIGEGAFYRCSGLTRIVIPHCVTGIGEGAFYECENLADAFLPKALRGNFERYAAFGDTTAVHYYSGAAPASFTVTLDANGGMLLGQTGISVTEGCSAGVLPVPVHGDAALGFMGWFTAAEGGALVTRWTNVSGDVTLYAHWGAAQPELDYYFEAFDEERYELFILGFRDADFYGDLVIPSQIAREIGGDDAYSSSVYGIAEYAFEEKSIASVSIPSSVTNIGECAFYGCHGLKSVAIPDSVTNVGEGAFADCENLTCASIPQVLCLGPESGMSFMDAGLDCVTNLVINDSVTSIGGYAFYGCGGLESVTIGNSVTNIGSYAFSDCSGLTSVTIPDSVTSIGGSAFEGCSGLTSVTIPDSVTSIGGFAFYGCSGLTIVTIPNSVTSIGSYAFSGCSSLTSVTIPDSVTNIGSYAFYGCSDSLFDTTTIPGVKLVDGWAVGYTDLFSRHLDLTGIRGIGDDAFSSCRGLMSVTIPDSVTNIGDAAFYRCGLLTKIVFEGNAPDIGEDVFVNVNPDCTVYVRPGTTGWGVDIPGTWNGVRIEYIDDTQAESPVFAIENGVLKAVELNGATEVTIPDSMTSIGDWAFSGCSGLMSVTIPDSVTNIGSYAFSDCSGLTSVTIPDSVTSIGGYAFEGCSGLTSVTIPDSMTSIGDWTFSGCSGLMSVTIPDSVTNIGNYAFYNCSGLTAFYVSENNQSYKAVNGLLLSKDGKTLIAGVNGDVAIPDSVTSIGYCAFGGCSGLTSVTIPDSVTNIEQWAFDDCSALKSFTVASGNEYYKAVAGFLLSKDGKTLIHGVTSEVGTATIPSGVESIGESAFYGCSGLTIVTIPNSVTSIGDWAFGGCSGLTSVTIPDSVTSIGDRAFFGCSGLTSVAIPDGVTGIGDYAFEGCGSLTNIVFEGNAPDFGEDVFVEVNPDCTVSVRPGTTGWGVDIPGTWNGLRIEYAEVLPPQVTVEINGASVEFETAEDGRTRTAAVAAGTAAEDVKVIVGGVDVTAGFNVSVEGTTATVVLREPFEGVDATGAYSPWTDSGDGNVTLNVNVVPGLYYAAGSAADIAALKRPGAAKPAKAGDRIVAPKQSGPQGFYKVWVSDAPISPESH